MIADAPVTMPPGEIPPGQPIESIEPLEAYEVLAQQTGMSPEDAKRALEESDRGKAQEDQWREEDERKRPRTTEDLRAEALGNVFGKGSPFGAYGEEAANTLFELGKTKDRIADFSNKMYEADQVKLEYANQAAAEALKGKIAERKYKKAQMHIAEDHQAAHKKAYDEYYGAQGRITRWEAKADDIIEKIGVTSREMGERGAWQEISDSFTWKNTLKAVGAVAALGANIFGRMALGSENVPNFAMPLIMNAIESDMRNDENKARDARLKGSEFISLGQTLSSIYDNKALSIEGYHKVGLAAAKAKMQWTKSRLPGTPDGIQRKKYLEMLEAEIAAEQAQGAIKRQKIAQDALLKTVQEYRNVGQAQRAADSAITARGQSQLNALTVLNSLTAEKKPDSQFDGTDRRELDAEKKFLSKARQIRNVAIRLLKAAKGDYGDIENFLTMKFKGLINRFRDNNPQGSQPHQDAVLLNSLLEEQVVSFGKSFEQRLTNEDFARYHEMLGTLENTSLINVLQRQQEAIYSARESFLTRMARAKKTADWDIYYTDFQVGLGVDDIDGSLDRFVESIKMREELGSTAALNRLDVGITPVQLVFDLAKGNVSPMEARQLSDRINQSVQGNFRSDYERVREVAERERADREARARETPVPGPGTSAAIRTSPTTEKPFKDENVGRYGQILTTMEITSSYGKRKHPVTKKWTDHLGTDFKADPGTPVSVPAAAEITEVGYDKYNGNFIRFIDAHGIEWTYSHLDKVGVQRGDRIASGVVIGATGQTGRVSGPHLHVQAKLVKTGKTIDPAPLFAMYMEKKKRK